MTVNPLRAFKGKAPRLAPWGLLLFLAGCGLPQPPFEATLALLQEKKVWRAEAETYAAPEYAAYRTRLRLAQEEMIRVERRFVLLRSYKELSQRYRDILAEGDRIMGEIQKRREAQKTAVEARIAAQRERLDRLDTLTSLISVGKSSREFLTKAALLVDEAESLAASGRYGDAEDRVAKAATFAQLSKEIITPALARFVDTRQVSAWREKVNETVRESRVRGGYAIVVSKVDRRLTLYKAGRPVKTYEVGLGSGSIRDKLCAGDRATPEGKYRVIRKLDQSRYYKALLINYPNEDDLRQFAYAKRNGLVSRRAGIGGLIEIHGGGKDGMTYGCVALDDHQMAELYALADVGTPVTIVGATDSENSISEALKGL